MVYDSHCGDTGCHLRAGMMNDFLLFLNQPSSPCPQWLTVAIESLNAVLTKAIEVSNGLARNRPPGDFGLNDKSTTIQEILRTLGWPEEFTRSLDDVTVSYVRPSSGTPCTAGGNHSTSTFWSTVSTQIQARFLVYGFSLSKYKHYWRSKEGIHCRIDLTEALSYGGAQQDDQDTKTYVYSPGGQRRLDREFKELQVWLTKLTCAWLRSLAQNSAPELRLLLSRTLSTSNKGILATACYPTYLVLREHWAYQKMGLVIVDRHICPSGHHYNVFEARMSLGDRELAGAVGRVEWEVRHITHRPMGSSSDHEAMLCVLGNSTVEPLQEFNQRVLSNVPHEGKCVYNDSHIDEFLAADHDRVFLTSFALHKPYPFETDPDRSMVQVFEERLSEHECIRDEYFKDRSNPKAINISGEKMKIIAMEHIYLEWRSKILDRVTNWSSGGTAVSSDGGFATYQSDGSREVQC